MATSSLNPEKIYNIVYEGYEDFVFDMAGEDDSVILYADAGSTQVTTDKHYSFATWDEMLKAPVFYGKTLAEAAPLMKIQEPWSTWMQHEA